MTGRHSGYIVTLAEDIREDDAEESVLNAIRMVRGVVSVVPVTASASQSIAEQRRDQDWRQALIGLLKNGP